MVKSVLDKLNYEPPVVPLRWLKDCIKKSEILPVDFFNNKTTMRPPIDQEPMMELDISEEDLTEALKSQMVQQPEITKKEEPTKKDVNVDIPLFDTPLVEISSVGKLFSNYSFQLSNVLPIIEKEQVQTIIERNGGKIHKNSYDFMIYPQSSKAQRDTNPKIRTITWLKDFEESNSLKNVNDSILYKPTF